ncbi:hypothetical protein BZA77DRAFT_353868 [Pyronema omphalodes]|nr:hypothetical protein BZA77DRAFT_353868 [Pyronema omphalodes]
MPTEYPNESLLAIKKRELGYCSTPDFTTSTFSISSDYSRQSNDNDSVFSLPLRRGTSSLERFYPNKKSGTDLTDQEIAGLVRILCADLSKSSGKARHCETRGSIPWSLRRFRSPKSYWNNKYDDSCSVHNHISKQVLRDIDQELKKFAFCPPEEIEISEFYDEVRVMGYVWRVMMDDDMPKRVTKVELFHNCPGCRIRRVLSEPCFLEAIVVGSDGIIRKLAEQASEIIHKRGGDILSLEKLMDVRNNMFFENDDETQ